ncbi:transducin beta-like protein 2 isoform X3 [Acropora millepora]|uniref:transducin beta-like protein 2 isoform X3 n=1 Tax=Acropora millepora TaxID=45264 RepID=UPI001CF3A457|nr:transducin beta-like protein 2 isoform X3 [Acropora millepora]
MPSAAHPLLAASLSGHDSFVEGVEFSSNGKYIMSSSSDRTVRLWSVKDFKQKEHQYVRANVEFDHGTKVTFSPDTSEDTKQQQPVRFRAFITALAIGNTIRVFKVSKKKEESRSSVTGEFDFPVKHSAEIINIAVASHGKFIMSCSRDTTIILWNLKGEVLSIIDTHQMNNSFASISPCGRFVASAGFTPDVKLWLVEFTKIDEFKQVSRAMELKGHTAGVYHFTFSGDSKRMATVSKDGTWKIWDIDVEFTKKQDPHLLITGIYDASFNIYDNMLISMSPDAYVTAITMGRSVVLFNTENGHLEEILQDVHGDAITAISWHPSSRYLATAGGDDRVIRVWHNAAGIKVQIEDLQGRLYRTRNENVKERIEQQILEARASLDKLNIIGQ